MIRLNSILCHWNHPEGEVRIGIFQPNFDTNPDTMMKYKGTVTIKYLGDDIHNEKPCCKYRIGGDGLKGHHGLMWVSREKATVEDLKIPIADNLDWDNFKFKFVWSGQMDLQRWEEFKDTEIKNLKSK